MMTFIKRLKLPAWLADRLARRSVTQNMPQTLSVFNKGVKAAFFAGLFKFLTIPIIAVGLLLWHGHPALRASYTWNGNNSAPVYYRCTYLAFDGWHELRPAPGINQCPLVIFLPFDFDVSGD